MHRLAEHAAAEKIVVELGLCFGRLIAVVYNRSGFGKPGSQGIEPLVRVTSLAHIVAYEQGLPEKWLLHDVKYYLAFCEAKKRTDFKLFGPHLVISLGQTGRLLAMKLQVCQAVPTATDWDDLAFLIAKMGLASVEAVDRVYQQFLPHDSLGADGRRIVTGLLTPLTNPA